MNASKAMDWIRLLFAQIDKVIYWLISVTYSIIHELTNISIFGSGDIQQFASRIYAFLGVIMLFKVTFSLVTYLIDPDAISDKTKGTGNLIKNIIITLFLIIIVPYGFDLLYRAQSAIINDNLIPKLVLGTEDTESTLLSINMDKEVCGTDETVADNYGDYLATVTLRPFLQISGDEKNSKADLITKLDSNFADAKISYCTQPVSSKLSTAVMYADTESLNSGQYIFDYKFFISTAFGILIFLLLLNFCFDIAVRTIKLGFLEIVAPIPIISYIDPKSGKDGIFKKWFKEVINTWLSLFIRLAVIYFAVYLITIINSNAKVISSENSSIIMLFLVVGALMFAKQAPGLIENIFGIKFNHTVQLNPFKKISDQALGGKAILGAGGKAVGTATGVVGGSIAGYKAGAEVGNIKKGMLVGALSGASAGYSNPKQAFSKSLDTTYKNLTGNEFARLSASKLIMGSQGKEKVDEIKRETNKARDQLRIENVRLNTASNTTAEIGTYLSRNGIDLKNLGAESTTQKSNLAKLQSNLKIEEQNLQNKTSKINEHQQKYDSLLEQYNKDKEYIDNYKPTIVDSDGKLMNSPEFEAVNKRKIAFEQSQETYINELRQLQSERDVMITNVSNIKNNIESTTDIINRISEYQTAYNQENESRKIISEIERDIKTLDSEKAQRERFYQVDKSPKESVEKAVASTAKREETYGIVRDDKGKIIKDSVNRE